MNGDNPDKDAQFPGAAEDTLMGTLESLENMIETGNSDTIPVLEDFVAPDEEETDAAPEPTAPPAPVEQQLDLYEDQINEVRQDLMDRFQHEIAEFVENDVHQVVSDTCETVMKSAGSQFEALLRYQLESSLRQILKDLTHDFEQQAAAELQGTTPGDDESGGKP